MSAHQPSRQVYRPINIVGSLIERRLDSTADMASPSTINPIIPGFAPDPSLILVDGTYFLVNSTFHLFPALPIYISQDLVHWKLIGILPAVPFSFLGKTNLV